MPTISLRIHVTSRWVFNPGAEPVYRRGSYCFLNVAPATPATSVTSVASSCRVATNEFAPPLISIFTRPSETTAPIPGHATFFIAKLQFTVLRRTR